MYSLINLCFLCLTNNKNVKSILAQDSDGVAFEEKLKDLFDVKIEQEIPKHICFHCLKNLNHVYDFKQQSLQNITKLNNYVITLRNSQEPYRNLQVASQQTNKNRSYCKTTNGNLNAENQTQTNFLETDFVVKREINATENTETEYVLLQDHYEQNNSTSSNIGVDKETDEEIPKNQPHSAEKQIEDSVIENVVVKIEPEQVIDSDENNETQEENISEEEEATEAMNVDATPTDSKNGKNRFECSDCGKAFFTRTRLKRHIRTHTGEKPYECDVCQKAFSHLGTLKGHRRTHTGEKPFECDVCQKTFSCLENLGKHKRIHIQFRPYTCLECNKSFIESSHLNRHKLIHTGVKSHQCELCPLKFARSGTLRDHMRTHTGEKPYQCSVCAYRCAQSGNLSEHVRSQHSGEKPHACAQCPQKFVSPGALNKHVKSKHKK